MVLLTMTPAMVAAIRESHRLLLDSSGAAREQGTEATSEPSLDDPRVDKPISHGQVIDLSRRMCQYSKDDLEGQSLYHLDTLLRGSSVYVPPPKPKLEPTAEFKELMARLRREEDARAYGRLIRPQTTSSLFSTTRPSPTDPLTAAADTEDEMTYADVNRQLALVLNVLISIIACSVAIWIACSGWSTPKRLGLSMGGSGVVGVAEVVVYAGYLRRLKDAKEKEKKEVERKEVLRTWVVGGEKIEEKPSDKGDAKAGARRRKFRKG